MWQYSDKVFEYFRNPKNLGEIENPDGRGEVGSDACGDLMQLTIKVDPETKKITDAKFKTFGCASAIASASVLTELIIGKTIDEAKKHKGIVELPWCGNEDCALEVENILDGNTLGEPIEEKRCKEYSCPICGHPAETWMRYAKTY